MRRHWLSRCARGPIRAIAGSPDCGLHISSCPRFMRCLGKVWSTSYLLSINGAQTTTRTAPSLTCVLAYHGISFPGETRGEFISALIIAPSRGLTCEPSFGLVAWSIHAIMARLCSNIARITAIVTLSPRIQWVRIPLKIHIFSTIILLYLNFEIYNLAVFELLVLVTNLL
jgi:hypothetical protein